MTNSWGIPGRLEKKIRDRDKSCVYCHKEFKKNPHDIATIEHMDENSVTNPEEWNVAICCKSCNSSRRMPLKEWFKTKYCKDRDINESTVSPVIKEYMKRCPNPLYNYGKRKAGKA